MEPLQLNDIADLRAKYNKSGVCIDSTDKNSLFGWVTQDSYVLCHHSSLKPEELAIEHLDKPFLGIIEERAKSMGVKWILIYVFTGCKLMKYFKRNGFVKDNIFCLNLKVYTMIKRLYNDKTFINSF
jgi:hypothetical protein